MTLTEVKIDILTGQLEQARKAFRQNPTPPMSTVIRQLENSLKYQMACKKKEEK